MALDALALTQTIISKYKAKMTEAFPDVPKGGTVSQIPKEDGSTEYQVVEQRGPMEIDEEGFRPLAEAVAEAVIEHLKSNGQVNDVSDGSNWRIT